MLRKISIALLFTLVFALVALFGNGQSWAQCGEGADALVPSELIIPTSDKTMRVYVDPCTGRFLNVEFCDPVSLSNCASTPWGVGMWWIDKDLDNELDPGETRSFEVVLDTAAHRGAYSNCVYYYIGSIRRCR